MIPRAGSGDSAAAMVTSSIPPKANATTRRPAATPDSPIGMNPSPSPSRWSQPTGPPEPGSQPSTSSTPMIRKPMITATLIAANQNSNSPKLATFDRFTIAKKVTNTRAGTHWGSHGAQAAMIPEAPVISAPSTRISITQYSQPMVKPAQSPIAERAYSANEPELGWAELISPSMRITEITSSPAIRYDSSTAGPAAAMP